MTCRRALRMVLVAGLLLPAGVSMADVGSVFKCHRGAHQSERRSTQGGGGQDADVNRQSIPEFDPTAAGSIAALLMGGGVLLVRRRRVR